MNRSRHKVFQQRLRPADTVLDVGAHVGYYTLLSSAIVGADGLVWAFEPSARNTAFLRDHIRISRCDNVRVTQAAVSDAAGHSRFSFGTGSGTGHLTDAGPVEVRTVRLDNFCAEQQIWPDAIKVDVEGAELSVLQGGQETIACAQPLILLSTHGREVHHRCLDWLRGAGYTSHPIDGPDVDTATEILGVPAAA